MPQVKGLNILWPNLMNWKRDGCVVYKKAANQLATLFYLPHAIPNFHSKPFCYVLIFWKFWSGMVWPHAVFSDCWDSIPQLSQHIMRSLYLDNKRILWKGGGGTEWCQQQEAATFNVNNFRKMRRGKEGRWDKGESTHVKTGICFVLKGHSCEIFLHPVFFTY